MRTISKLLIALATVLVLGVSFADARLTPGTIQKGQYTGANTCNTSQNCYSPTGGSCVNSASCQAGHYGTAPCTQTNASGACTAYGTAPYICDDYYTTTSMSGQSCFTNYLLNSETLTYGAVGSGNQKLGVDSSVSCSRSSNGTNHTPAVQSGNVSCEQ